MEIEGYEDLIEIGRGGYAVVYKAHQAGFGRTVAIKVLTNPGFGETDRARFEREALAMGRLSWHPNIVIVHSTGTTTTGMPFLIEEYLEGGSLGDKLRRTGPFGPAEALSDMIQLCAAVHTAHEADLLHRDIKPDNALVDAFGRVKLADFGIAAVTGSTLTATGMVTATIAHAAPEVLNGERATFQADVYSLGSTLYELLTGGPAFVRETDESIVPLVVRVTTDPVPDLVGKGVPAPVAEAVEWAMAKDPADRPASALEYGKKLQSAQQALGLKVTDLSVRGGPTPLHDDTLIGGPAIPPPVVAVTPPPPPNPVPVPSSAQVTSATPVAAEMASATGTVAVPQGVVTPAPGGENVKGPPQKETRSKLPIVLAVLVVLVIAAVAFMVLSGGDDGGGNGGQAENFGEAGGAVGSAGTADPGSSTPTTGGPEQEPTEPAVITTGDRPFRLAIADGSVWATDSLSTTVDRIDIETNTVVETIDIGGEPAGVDTNDAGVWVSNFGTGTVEQIDPASNEIVDVIDVGDGPRNVSATEQSVWVANFDDDTVSRIDVAAGEVQANIEVGVDPRGMAASDDDVWVTNSGDGTVTRIDPSTNQITDSVDVGGNPIGVVLTAGDVWVAEADGDIVVRIDRETYEVVDRIAVGVDPGGMASTDERVYVSTSGDDTVSTIDAESGEVLDQVATGLKPGGLAVSDTDLWVANTDADTVQRIPLG